MASFDEMRAYAHAELYPLIRNRAGFEHTAAQALVEAAADGVRVLEMSLDADFCRFYEGPVGFLDFIRRLAAQAPPLLDFRPEIGVSKNRDPAAQVRLAMECVESGLFRSIDLYGNEDAQEPEAYAELYRRAAWAGLKRKAHAGEFGDAPLVERTVRSLGLRRAQREDKTRVDAAAAVLILQAFLDRNGIDAGRAISNGHR